MADLHQAVEAARTFLTQAVSDPKGIQVEEIELGDDSSTWSITLSYLRPLPEDESWDALQSVLARVNPVYAFSAAAERLERPSHERVYRKFEVRGDVVRSMTIREFAAA